MRACTGANWARPRSSIPGSTAGRLAAGRAVVHPRGDAMHFAAVLFLLQQLEVTPFPAEAGEPGSIRLTTGDAPQPGVAVAVELPEGSRRPVGSTDAKGEVRYVPVEPGLY